MAFEVVGVQLYQAGREVVVFTVDGGDGGRTGVDGGDLAVADDEGARGFAVWEEEAGIGEDGFLRHGPVMLS